MNTVSISPCNNYRYYLESDVSKDDKKLLFIMLNPSTADAKVDDPTIRRCKSFCKYLGYGKLGVLNLYALRSYDPDMLKRVSDPIGPGFDEQTRKYIEGADMIICAWGVDGWLRQEEYIEKYLKGKTIYCLGITKGGFPRHPLYVHGNTTPIVFRG